MAKQPKTEEQLKADIFETYSQLQDVTSSDRRQVYVGRLCDLIYRWCKGFLYKIEADEMGEEIFRAALRMTKDNLTTVPKKEDEFLGYLRTVLKNAKNLSHRNRVSGSLKIPRIVKDVAQVLRMEESDVGRKLTENERVECVSKFFNKTEESAKKYLERLDTKFNSGLESNNDDDELDILNLKETKSPYMPNITNNPQDEYLAKLNGQIIRDAVESVLKKKQQRTKKIYRELFTVYCFDNVLDYKELLPVLDAEIIKAYQEGKKPFQYEIYLKYHPGVADNSADSRASEMCHSFINDLKAAVKEKHPEIDLPNH